MNYINKDFAYSEEETIFQLLLDQITEEYKSYFVYINIAQIFNNIGLVNLNKFAMKQANEELDHARKFIDFLADNGVFFQLGEVESTITVDNNPIDHTNLDKIHRVKNALLIAKRTEEKLSDSINNIYGHVNQSNFHKAESLLSWFCAEQVEEEDQIQTLLDQLNLTNDLLLLDNSDYVRSLLD